LIQSGANLAQTFIKGQQNKRVEKNRYVIAYLSVVML